MNLHSNRVTSFRARGLLSLLAGLLIGAGVAALSPGDFFRGWLAASLLLVPAVFALLIAWQWAGGGRMLAWIIALAFLLRLIAGIGLSFAISTWGYDEPEQQAGYLFKDAYVRDQQAWGLVQSSDPLWKSFQEDFYADQYGGLMALSGLVYRYLSPDAHRPFLVLILGAFVTALGVPFLFQAIQLRWSLRVASIAVWIYALYPDGIYFGSAQMREPFLIGLAAIAFWAVIAWDWRSRRTWILLAVAFLAMALISNRVAAAVAGFLGLLFLLEHLPLQKDARHRTLGWIMFAVGVAGVLLFTWGWFRSSVQWDALLTARGSGQIETRIKEIGEQWMVPFLAVYGLVQPVLPATLTETSIPLAKTIVVIRSLGWYALAPFLLYGMFLPFKHSDPRVRRMAVWLLLVVFSWLVIASLRGGGDLTDNPRYRSLFLPWLALLAAWSIDFALARKDAWLWRWVAVEVIFVAFFTHWYISRYYRLWFKMMFWDMVLAILALSGVVLVGGWLWDRYSPVLSRNAKTR